MTDFSVDAELHDRLKAIRESVRAVFEQLRLRDENGDVSGKERLERVPALAKRNFANLTHPNRELAIKEAWRLVDFLEGSEEARLTPLARDALRPVELDWQLARLRGSAEWQEAAVRLREALGAASPHGRPPGDLTMGEPARSQALPAGREVPTGLATDPSERPDAHVATRSPHLGRSARPLTIALIGLVIAGGLAWLALRPDQGQPDPRVACLPLERASAEDLAAHWAVRPRRPAPLPPSDPSRPDPVVLTISDPPNGPVRSIFTTSQFSYDGEGGEATGGPGGGLADGTLRVGGWGDTYVSLVKFPVPDDRPVRRAVLRLVALGSDPINRPTAMVLRVIHDPWEVEAGPQRRLWWRDCPRSEAFGRLPAPGASGTPYQINITEIYNLWVSGAVPNHGLMLEPENIGRWGSSADRYPNINVFHSTRAIDPANRPKLILTY